MPDLLAGTVLADREMGEQEAMGTGRIATVCVILAAFMVMCLCVYVIYTNEGEDVYR